MIVVLGVSVFKLFSMVLMKSLYKIECSFGKPFQTGLILYGKARAYLSEAPNGDTTLLAVL
jgi:hypothetical protein